MLARRRLLFATARIVSRFPPDPTTIIGIPTVHAMICMYLGYVTIDAPSSVSKDNASLVIPVFKTEVVSILSVMCDVMVCSETSVVNDDMTSEKGKENSTCITLFH